jgi:membrane protease YdiL (CAAX protease family)
LEALPHAAPSRHNEAVVRPVSRGVEPMSVRGRYIIAYPALLFVSWIIAWIINLAWHERFHWDVQTDTIYWIAMKVIVWVAPALLAIRVLERESLVQFLELSHAGRGVLWGGLVGLALVAVTYLGKTLPAGTPAHVPSFSLVLLNAVVVAPLVEEIALRGLFLKRLELNGRSFWSANVLTTLVFVAMHLPGWLFKGRFPSMASLAQAMVPLAMLSLLFGWTKKRAQSLYGSILVHAINNLYSAWFP